jgi:phosphatidylglycerol:prolipoprotein diacylglycerol transferase
MLSFFPSREVAVQIAGFSVHWYGIMYLLAFIVCAIMLPRLQRYRNLRLTHDEWLSIMSWTVFGVIVGGRLGFVLLYEPAYFASHPLKIFAVWEGGMSFHGGLMGVVVVLVLSAFRRGVSITRIADVVVVPAAIGLALGRFGNFINLELYGTPTDLPWGIMIPGVEGLRHPTQLYAMGKDLLIALSCFLHLRYGNPKIPGRTFALFLILYGIGRFLMEFVRAQQYPLVGIGNLWLTRGQLLTIPVFLTGVLWWTWMGRMQKSESK